MNVRLAIAIVLSLLLLPAAIFAVYSCIVIPFHFDAPGTKEQTATWIMAGAVLSLPLSCLGALAGAWIAAIPPTRTRWWYSALALPLLSLLVFWVAGSLRPGFF